MNSQRTAILRLWLVCFALWAGTTGFRCGGLIINCLADADCGVEQRCRASRCTQPQPTCNDSDCPAGYACDNNKCTPVDGGCRTDADCNAIQRCIEAACVACETQTERCNNLDDNCDGKIDESLSRSCQTACGTGNETCKGGIWRDCDAPSPKTEICDEKDNNCDGKIDEGCECRMSETRPCGSDTGECQKGTQRCNGGQWSQRCEQSIEPTAEICDEKDNNCDGKIDEGCECRVGENRSCGSDTGECQKGTQECKDGRWASICKESKKPSKEVCDNKDNDCDGKVDNDVQRSCKRGCNNGIERCQNGTWGTCDAAAPDKELCDDGIDNDCSGQIDDGCPTGPQALYEWCNATDRRCKAGLVCHNNVCYRPCAQNKGLLNNPDCPSNHECSQHKGQLGACKAICMAVASCPKHTYCSVKGTGKCIPNDPPQYGTRQAGEICSTGTDITEHCNGQKGFACVSGTCKRACDPRKQNADCPSPQTCLETFKSFLGGVCIN